MRCWWTCAPRPNGGSSACPTPAPSTGQALLSNGSRRRSRNGEFADQLKQALAGRAADSGAPVVFLCRSGSVPSARRSRPWPDTPPYNVLEGFEGPLDANGHRGSAGWRALGLAWRQS